MSKIKVPGIRGRIELAEKNHYSYNEILEGKLFVLS